MPEATTDQFYLVDRYDLYSTPVRVRATSLADAMLKVSNGEGLEAGDPSYIEIATSYGRSAQQLDEKTHAELLEASDSPLHDDGFVAGISGAVLDLDQRECQDTGD